MLLRLSEWPTQKKPPGFMVEITRATRAMDVRGWDSLSHTMVLMQLEDGFEIQLPMDRALRLGNVGEMVDLIAELLLSGGGAK